MMISHTLIAIADAVVDALNDEFGEALAITVQRTTETELELEDADTLHIDVVPGSVKSEIGTRESQRGEFSIDIAVRKKIDPHDRAAVDALFAIENDIDKHLFGLQRLPQLEAAAWIASSPRYPYVAAHLRNLRQFTGILTVTYLVYDD